MVRDPSEDDLHAYVDGLADPAQVPAIEAYLAANPAAAARLRDYHRLNRDIRLGLEAMLGDAPAATAGLEARLHRRLFWGRALRRFGAVAAAALMVAGGWSLHGWLPVPADGGGDDLPVFADEAADAHRTAHEAGPGLTGATPADPRRLARLLSEHAGTPIALPAPAPELRLRGATLMPWDHGTGLQIVYQEPDGEMVTLFIVADDTDDRIAPHAIDHNGVRLVYWKSGRIGYTVSGAETDDDLVRLAKAMAAGTT